MMEEIITENWQIFLFVIAILAVTVVLAYIVNRAFNRFIRRSVELTDADPTNYNFIKHSLVAIIYLTGISFAIWNIPAMKHIAQSLIAGAGILAIAVGFASQQALGNIISGIFIVIFKPYRLNDRITVRDTLSGVVEDINLWNTIIRNFENRRIIVPNSVMSNEVVINSNYEDDLICRFIEVGISYDSDIDKAKSIVRDEVLNHPDFIDNRKPKDIEEGVDAVPVRVIAMGDFSVTLRAWAWANDPAKAFIMGCDLLESIKKRFDREGIEIPFPYRTLVFKDPKNRG